MTTRLTQKRLAALLLAADAESHDFTILGSVDALAAWLLPHLGAQESSAGSSAVPRCPDCGRRMSADGEGWFESGDRSLLRAPTDDELLEAATAAEELAREVNEWSGMNDERAASAMQSLRRLLCGLRGIEDRASGIARRIEALTDNEVWDIVREHYGSTAVRDFKRALIEALGESVEGEQRGTHGGD